MKALLQNIQKEITEGIFVDLKLINGKVEAFSTGEHIGTVSCKQNPFRIPDRKLKAHVLKNIGDEYEIEILTYVDLHRHSSYSLLDSMAKVEQMVEKTEYAGALTDHGVMFGMVEYYETMKKNNKLPIIGFEAYTTDKSGQLNRNHLILLAKNEKGYRNLIKLTSNSYETFLKKPHVTYKELKKHREGVIVLSACIGGEIPKAILSGNYEKAKEIALNFKELFADDFYLEIQRHGIPEEDIVNPKLIQLSKELGIKLVATTDSHYINKEDSYAHEVLCCIRTGRTMNDEKRFKFPGTGYHIHTPEEMESKYSDLIEAMDNTLEIAEKCKDFKMEFGNISMPVVDLPKEFSSVDQYLKTLAFEGFKNRFRNTPHFTDPVYIERLQYELDVISQTGFPGYFIIVWDFIKYARENGIAVGPGRGSAVGCLVAYCLNITDIDPIKYNLLFERFLNTERVSMPDMDIDFEHERRQEVIDYVVRKYGERAVSKIITFGTMGAKMACRDVARALGHETRLGDTVAGLIPSELKMTISKAIVVNPKLKEAVETNSDVREIVRVASLLEGCQRHSSVHACGILIAPGEISNYLPTAIVKDEETNKKELTSQVNMVEAEQLGILKMDFLGLRTMGVLSELSRQTGEDYSKLPINDPYVYAEISKGQTYCVFQLESAGMRKFMTELFADVPQKIIEIEKKYNLKGFSKPTGDMTNVAVYLDEMGTLGDSLFERAIAGVSLYRPGPMDCATRFNA